MSGGNTLGGNNRNPRFFNNMSVPDTDSRGIELNTQGLAVIPNLMYDHTRMQYTSPVNDLNAVSIGNFINGEERSLHTLILNNSKNIASKVFNFTPAYVFLDSGNNVHTVTVSAAKTAFFFGVIIMGKMYLRESIESTN